ncbi:MAG: S1 RNA-binding domain-containing protein [Acidobacteriota bacterium]
MSAWIRYRFPFAQAIVPLEYCGSIVDLEPNRWDRFFNTHKLDDEIKGRVVRFGKYGAFIEIEEGIEGPCQVSELSESRVEKPEDAVKIGELLPFKILKLDPSQKKIGLSARVRAREVI